MTVYNNSNEKNERNVTVMKIKLREVRQSQGMSYRKLAARSGVSLSQIEKIESGYTNNPKLETVYKLAKALGVTINDLVE